MNKEERVKLVFETISKIVGFEIKPDKEFYIIGNSETTVYIIDEFLNLLYKNPDGYFNRSDYTILPLFKGGYQLEEIKEPLLTEEAKDFLRQFKFKELKISPYLHMNLYDENNILTAFVNLNKINHSFDGLEKYRRYTEEELGL